MNDTTQDPLGFTPDAAPGAMSANPISLPEYLAKMQPVQGTPAYTSPSDVASHAFSDPIGFANNVVVSHMKQNGLPQSGMPMGPAGLQTSADALGFVPDATPTSSTPAVPNQPPVNAPPMTLAPASTGDNWLSTFLKATSNVPSSALNVALGALKLPFQATGDIAQIPGAAADAVQAEGGGAGGILKTIKDAAGSFLPNLYKTAVPQSGQDLVTAAQQYLAGKGGSPEATAALQDAQKNMTNDPIGQVLPYFLVGREAAYRAGMGDAFDSAVSKVGSAPGNALGTAADTVGKVLPQGVKDAGSTLAAAPGDVARSVASFATGMDPETISQIWENPSEFSKTKQGETTRVSAAKPIQDALDQMIAQQEDTGSSYADVRNSDTPVKVNPDTLDQVIQDATKTDIQGGKITPTTESFSRDPKDIAAVQKFYDDWKPTFDSGQMTPSEFLNMREDLGKMAKYGKDVGSSKPVENMGNIIRGTMNSTLRDQIPGLSEKDADFSTQAKELKDLRDGITTDSNGQLTDSAINKIANATSGTHPNLLAKLEEASPGITSRVKIMKAVADIQKARGNKVGTYTRAFVEGAPLYSTLGPAGIMGALMAFPDIAVPLLRGMAASGDLAGDAGSKILDGIKTTAGYINKSPNLALPAAAGEEQTANP